MSLLPVGQTFAQLLGPVSNAVIHGAIKLGYTEDQVLGYLRWNSSSLRYEFYNGILWAPLAVTNDLQAAVLGFPLNADVSANLPTNSFGITNLGFVEADRGYFDLIFLRDTNGTVGVVSYAQSNLYVNGVRVGTGSGAGFPLDSTVNANTPGNAYGVTNLGVVQSYTGVFNQIFVMGPTGSSATLTFDGTNLLAGGVPVGSGMGSGFPLTNNVTANSGTNQYGIGGLGYFTALTGTVSTIQLNGPTGSVGSITFDGSRILLDGVPLASGTNGSGGLGSLYSVQVFTNLTDTAPATFVGPSVLGLVAGDNVLLTMFTNSSTSVSVRVSANTIGVGPQGPAGLGTNLYYFPFYQAGLVTAPRGYSVASYGGDLWITSVTGHFTTGSSPESDIGGGWAVWITGGEDGSPGATPNGANLFFRSENPQGRSPVLTNELYSFEGSLWVARTNYDPGPAVNPNFYYEVVRAGRSPATSTYFLATLTWRGTFDQHAYYPSNSVVKYVDGNGKPGLALASIDIGVGASDPPFGFGWVNLAESGQAGPPGADGLDGVGNLQYMAWYDSQRSYPSNVLVSFTIPGTQRKNIYRSLVSVSSNVHPYLYTNAWQEVISSGFESSYLPMLWRGNYNSAEHYNPGDIVRYGPRTYFQSSAETNVIGLNPQTSPFYWTLLVQDSMASIMTNFSFRGYYEGSAGYSVGDSVSYGGVVWLFTNATAGVVMGYPPMNGSPYWKILIDRGPEGPQGPAGTNYYYYVTNLYNVQTQILYVGTNYYTTNFLFGSTNVYETNFVYTLTGGVQYVEAFGVTNPLPLGLRILGGENFGHTVDSNSMSLVTFKTNFTDQMTGTLSYVSAFGVSNPYPKGVVFARGSNDSHTVSSHVSYVSFRTNASSGGVTGMLRSVVAFGVTNQNFSGVSVSRGSTDLHSVTGDFSYLMLSTNAGSATGSLRSVVAFGVTNQNFSGVSVSRGSTDLHSITGDFSYLMLSTNAGSATGSLRSVVAFGVTNQNFSGVAVSRGSSDSHSVTGSFSYLMLSTNSGGSGGGLVSIEGFGTTNSNPQGLIFLRGPEYHHGVSNGYSLITFSTNAVGGGGGTGVVNGSFFEVDLQGNLRPRGVLSNLYDSMWYEDVYGNIAPRGSL